ncbi:MAG: hypothetical protein ACT4QC_20515 [Planctomycetaceae bacterium]
MIEVRTFDGEPRELADFCVSSWRKRYAGRMLVPLWSPEFLEWELFSPDHESRDYLVAAYDRTRLVGVLPARPAKYHLHGRPVRGTWGSFFGVDPEYENDGVSLKLNLEQRRRHRERGAQVLMGFVYVGSRASMGKDFWFKQRSLMILRKLGLWARLIDHRAVSDFEFSTRDRWATRMLGWFQGAPKPPRDAAGTRPYNVTDLPDCLRLARQVSQSAEWGYDWDETSLSRHLAWRDVTRTVVAEDQGRVEGFISWCHLDLLGNREVTAAVIDVASFENLSPARQQSLLRSALCEMAAEGCHLALMLRISCYPARALLSAGFIPQPAEHYYVAQSMGSDVFSSPVHKLHVHWR